MAAGSGHRVPPPLVRCQTTQSRGRRETKPYPVRAAQKHKGPIKNDYTQRAMSKRDKFQDGTGFVDCRDGVRGAPSQALAYRIDGAESEGPWVTLSHSLATDLSIWDPQILAFGSPSYRPKHLGAPDLSIWKPQVDLMCYRPEHLGAADLSIWEPQLQILAFGSPRSEHLGAPATDLSIWKPQVEELSKKYKVLRFDTRGHGRSCILPGPYSLEDITRDAIFLWDQLGIDRSHWVGISLGGMLGQAAAIHYPHRVRSLVLADTTARFGPEHKPMWEERAKIALSKGMEPHVNGTLERWFTEPFRKTDQTVIPKIASLIRNTNPVGYAACCDAISNLDYL
eukprot:g60091.t1